MLRRVTVRYGEVGYGSHVMAKLVKFGLGVLWQSRRVIAGMGHAGQCGFC